MRAVPGAGLRVPIWILGSSLFGAAGGRGARPAVLVRVAFRAAAAARGDRHLPRAFHSRPSIPQQPYVMLGVNIVAADTDDEARFLASSGRQSFASLRAGRPITLPPPSKEWERDPSDRPMPLEPDARVVCRIAGDHHASRSRSSSGDAGRRADRGRAHLRSPRATFHELRSVAKPCDSSRPATDTILSPRIARDARRCSRTALDGHMDREIEIDLCVPCQSVWFDARENLQLTPGATLAMFRSDRRERGAAGA